MPTYTLTFASQFGSYPIDKIWKPNHPRYGESSLNMIRSGHWTWGGQPINRSGTVSYNEDFAGGASLLGVNNDPGTGDEFPTCNAWDFQGDFLIDRWPGPPNSVVFLTVAGLPNPPYPPSTGAGIRLGFTRAGFFFTLGQSVAHTEGTGVAFTGGPIGVHLEVTPRGPWWLRAFVAGALAYTACGDRWGGGELFAASWGCLSVAGPQPSAVLKTTSVSGTMGNQAGLVECPHDPFGLRRRSWALWWPE